MESGREPERPIGQHQVKEPTTFVGALSCESAGQSVARAFLDTEEVGGSKSSSAHHTNASQITYGAEDIAQSGLCSSPTAVGTVLKPVPSGRTSAISARSSR